MATNPIEISIKQLPQINTVQGGDYLIVETPDGTSIIDYQDITIDLDQTTFEPTITDLIDRTAALDAAVASLSSGSGAALQGVGSSIVFKNITRLDRSVIFSGPDVDLPLTFIEINELATQATDNVNTSTCADVTLSVASSGVVIPKGIYKASADVTLTSASTGVTWATINLYQKSQPEGVLLIGSTFMATGSGQTGNLTLRGYISLCRDSEVSVRATSFGDYRLGGIDPIFMIESLDQQGMGTTLLSYSACNIALELQYAGSVGAFNVNTFR